MYNVGTEHRVSYESLLVLYMGRVMEMDYSKGFHQLKSSAKPKIRISKVVRNEMVEEQFDLDDFLSGDDGKLDTTVKKARADSMYVDVRYSPITTTKTHKIKIGEEVLEELGYKKKPLMIDVVNDKGVTIKQQSQSKASSTGKPRKDWQWEYKDKEGIWQTNTDDSVALGIRDMKVVGDDLVLVLGLVDIKLANVISWNGECTPKTIDRGSGDVTNYLEQQKVTGWGEDKIGVSYTRTGIEIVGNTGIANCRRFDDDHGMTIYSDKSAVRVELDKCKWIHNLAVVSKG